MIEFPPIAGHPDDAPHGTRQNEGKPGEFARALGDAVRAVRDETDARERAQAPRSDNAPDRPGHAVTQTEQEPAQQVADEPVADPSEPAQQVADEPVADPSEPAAHVVDEPVADPSEPDTDPASSVIDATEAEITDTDTDAVAATIAVAATAADTAPDEPAPTVVLAGDTIAPVEDSQVTTAETTENIDGDSATTETATVATTVPPVDPVDGEADTNITITAGDGEVPAPAAETLSPTAAQDPEVPAAATATTATATGPVTTQDVAPTLPGSAEPSEQTPDWAARLAAPPRSPVVAAALAGKLATPPGQAATPPGQTATPPGQTAVPVVASGKPTSAGANTPAAAVPDTAVQATAADDAPGPSFARMLGNGEANAATGQNAPASANASPTAPAGANASPTAPAGADATVAQTQAATTPATDQLLPTREPMALDVRAAAPQIQPATPASAFANEIRVAADLSPATETAAGRLPPSAAGQQVSFQIARSVQAGLDRFTLELKPADLGRVSVKMEIGFDNRVIVVISAERAETLDLLQRDARLLERALQESGLKTDQGSLSFNLRGDGAGGNDNGDDAPAGQLATMDLDDDMTAALDGAATATIASADGPGVNIQV